MNTFEYDITIQASNQNEAEQKMKSLITILNKLNAEELKKVADVVSNPVQLAIIKSKIL